MTREPAAFDPTDPLSVVSAMYAMISGPAGPRDWAAQDHIFHPDARQMRTGVDGEGAPWLKIMDTDQYRRDTIPYFDTHAFYEIEIARRIDLFGNMAHVWSVYEARNELSVATPERRGVNSIQLYRDARGHWKIMSMIWDNERDGLAITPF